MFATGLALASSPAQASVPTQLSSSLDTTFNSQAPSKSYGSATTIYASPTSWKAFVRFPSAQIDDDAVITSATLRVYGTKTSTSKWEVHPASAAWSESTTYKTMPAWDTTVLGRSVSSARAGTWNEIALPVSAISTTADTNLGIVGTVTGKIGFHSRENTYPPQLVLTYASGVSGVSGDTTPPDTSITSGPPASDTSTTATFGLASTEPGTFACSLDGAAFSACTSPWSVSGLSDGSHTFQVQATDTAGNVDPTPAAYTWQVSSGGSTTPGTGTPQPTGVPGAWTPVFADEFDGTSLDLTKWSPNWYGEGGSMNNVGTYASNVSVANGELRLQLDSVNGTVRGALVHTGYGSGRYALPVGGVVEARVYFPGESGQDIYNWPAWWASGPSWPSAGEHDIAEGLGGDLTVNYHGTTNSSNYGTPSGGPWRNAFHVFTLHRKASSADVYWDGNLVRSYPTGDNGNPEELIFNIGKSNSRTPVLGAAGAIRVDYVRAWKPAG